MKALLRALAGIWYWRHVVYPVKGNLFSGPQEMFCRCGGTIELKHNANGRRPAVVYSTCPAGRAEQWIGGAA